MATAKDIAQKRATMANSKKPYSMGNPSPSKQTGGGVMKSYDTDNGTGNTLRTTRTMLDPTQTEMTVPGGARYGSNSLLPTKVNKMKRLAR